MTDENEQWEDGPIFATSANIGRKISSTKMISEGSWTVTFEPNIVTEVSMSLDDEVFHVPCAPFNQHFSDPLPSLLAMTVKLHQRVSKLEQRIAEMTKTEAGNE